MMGDSSNAAPMLVNINGRVGQYNDTYIIVIVIKVRGDDSIE